MLDHTFIRKDKKLKCVWQTHNISMRKRWPEVRNLTRASSWRLGNPTGKTNSCWSFYRLRSLCLPGRSSAMILKLWIKLNYFLNIFLNYQPGLRHFGFLWLEVFSALKVRKYGEMADLKRNNP